MPFSLPPYLAYLLTAVLAMVISIYGVRKTIFITRNRKLYDKPDDIRKIHGAEIPSMGGIGIFMGYVVASAFFWRQEISFMPFFIASSAILLFTGIYDDIMNMRPSKKLVAQLLASFITIACANIRITSLYGFCGIHDIPYWPSILLTTLLCTFFINVFNFIDGIDGLACTLAILYTGVLGVLFFRMNEQNIAGICFSLMGATAGLFWFNVAPAKIYMGDTGSMFLGFNIFIFTVFLLHPMAGVRDITYSNAYFFNSAGRFMLLFAILFVPTFDAIRVFILRMSRGISPLKADRTHLHYYLLDAGFTHSQAVMVIVGSNILTIAVAYLMQDINPLATIASITALSLAVLGVVYKLRQKRVKG